MFYMCIHVLHEPSRDRQRESSRTAQHAARITRTREHSTTHNMGACLSSAPTYGLPYGDLSEEAKQLKTELENAGGIDAPDEKFETPLTRALSDKDNARVRMLLDIGANPSCIIQRLHPSIHPDTIPSGTKLGSGYQQNGPPPWHSR